MLRIENHGLEESEFLLCYHLHDEIQSNPVHATEQCFNRTMFQQNHWW